MHAIKNISIAISYKIAMATLWKGYPRIVNADRKQCFYSRVLSQLPVFLLVRGSSLGSMRSLWWVYHARPHSLIPHQTKATLSFGYNSLQRRQLFHYLSKSSTTRDEKKINKENYSLCLRIGNCDSLYRLLSSVLPVAREILRPWVYIQQPHCALSPNILPTKLQLTGLKKR